MTINDTITPNFVTDTIETAAIADGALVIGHELVAVAGLTPNSIATSVLRVLGHEFVDTSDLVIDGELNLEAYVEKLKTDEKFAAASSLDGALIGAACDAILARFETTPIKR